MSHKKEVKTGRTIFDLKKKKSCLNFIIHLTVQKYLTFNVHRQYMLLFCGFETSLLEKSEKIYN